VTQSMCIALPQLLAGLDVEKRQAEENHCEQQHHRILHSRSPSRSTIGSDLRRIESRLHSSPNRFPGNNQRKFAKKLWQGDVNGNQTASPRTILARNKFEYRKDFLNKA
jgi:hypothetical protein